MQRFKFDLSLPAQPRLGAGTGNVVALCDRRLSLRPKTEDVDELREPLRSLAESIS